MLADFQNAYSSFVGGSAISADQTKKMTFSKENSLSGAMTYQPSGITLDFEPFHNILAGTRIIPGIARFAAQQLYALCNITRDLSLSFGAIGLSDLGDNGILNMVLKLFKLQVMVPYGVVPLHHDQAGAPETH